MIKKRMIRTRPLLIAVLIAATAGRPGWTQGAGGLRVAAGAEPQFTAASLKGTCGFSAASTNVNSRSPAFLHPAASFGTLVFDGIGSVSGERTVNDSGKLFPAESFVGSYSVGADGRTGTLDFTAHGGSIYTFVITSGGAEIRYINVGPVDPASGIVDAVTIATCRF
jgi:hypothetical protein